MNVAGTFIAMAGVIYAQPATSRAAFDVASVKPNLSEVSSSSISRSGGRITLENVTLRDCIAFAFGIATGREYELSGPGWLDSEKFDIAATFPTETSRDRVLEMLQTMLAERFALKTHREDREIEGYALVAGKGGSKLRAASASGDGAFIWGRVN